MMGSHNIKQKKDKIENKTEIKQKKLKLTEKDYKFLISQSNKQFTRAEIKEIFDKFIKNNPEGLLDKEQFIRLYVSMRTEGENQLYEIAELAFHAFDADRNGYVTFNEFMVAYALTSRGDLKSKLEYSFALYDADDSGYLDADEIRDTLMSMFNLLGIDRNRHNLQKLSEECIEGLDANKDGQISKDEFIDGLLKNYALRVLMCPFN